MYERTHVDLFSGIGGFALAARANWLRTVQFCECDPRCRDFLAKAWPGVPCWPDVRTFRWGTVENPQSGRRNGQVQPREREGLSGNARPTQDGRPVYLLTAGVPCQPASRAGKQRGAADDRWLWPQAVRGLSEVRPAWALFENPPGIGDVGLAGVLADVAAVGYEVRVFGIPACAVGSPHRRERYWIVCRRVADIAEQHGTEYGQPSPVGGRSIADGMADAALGGLGADGRAPGHTGHTDQCGQGGVDKPAQSGRTDRAQLQREHDREGFADGPVAGQWSRYVWLPCADGKLRRAPGDAFGLVDGLHRSVLAAPGNSIVPQVAARVIAAMVEADDAALRGDQAKKSAEPLDSRAAGA
jgi:site-specific DNA-cytosine methylase